MGITMSARVSRRLSYMYYFEKWLILGTVVGAVVGYFILGFSYLLKLLVSLSSIALGASHEITLAYKDISYVYPYISRKALMPLIILTGVFVSSCIVYRFAKEAEGPGTDAAISAYHLKGARVNAKVPVVKAISSAIAIGTGSSGGVAGPGIQIGSGIASVISRVFNLRFIDRRIMFISGMAAALSTLFRSPIGGALFAVEMLHKRDIESRAFIPAMISSFVAYMATYPIIGLYPILPYPQYNYARLYSPEALLSVAIMSLFIAPFSLAYSKLFHTTGAIVDRLRRKMNLPIVFKPIIGALAFCVLALFFPELMGSGYGVIHEVYDKISSSKSIGVSFYLMLILLAFLKIVATSLSIGSGASGGVFAPAVFIGSLLGISFGGLVGIKISGVPPTVWMIVGISTFLGATLKTPLAASVMVSEMCGNYMILLPALFGAVIAREITGDVTICISQKVRRVSERNLKVLALYEHLLETSSDLLKSRIIDVVTLHTPMIVGKEDTIGDVVDNLIRTGKSVALIVQGEKILGCIDFSVIELMPFLRRDSPVYALPTRKMPVLRYDETLENVLVLFMSGDYDYMIVRTEDGEYQVVYLEDVMLEVASKVLK